MKVKDDLDELDLNILRELESNPNVGVRELARKVKVPKSTIYYRLQRLKRLGVIKGYNIIIDSEALGYEYHVVVFVRAKYGPHYHDEVGKILSNNPYVQAVYYILGDWDFVVLAKFPKKEVYMDFLETLINSKFVERSNTFIVAKIYKEDFRLKI
ncbi:MAG: Lrp/AsnC family transcriptional regulator [Thermosphaera sp.]